MKYFSLLLLGISCSCVAHGQSQVSSCLSSAGTQAQMNVCATRELDNANAALHSAHQRLLSEVSADSMVVTKIKVEERAWKSYRDAYMDAMYPAKNKQAEYGSIYPMESNLLRAKLTRQHVVVLEHLIKQYLTGQQ